MINLDLDWSKGPRRLEDFAPGELEAFMQRGRTLQARAMGRGLQGGVPRSVPRARSHRRPVPSAATSTGSGCSASTASARRTAAAADPARTARADAWRRWRGHLAS